MILVLLGFFSVAWRFVRPSDQRAGSVRADV